MIMRKYIIVLLGLMFTFILYSCKEKILETHIKYSILSPDDELNSEIIPLDTVAYAFTFASGFNKDRVKVFHNGEKISDKIISTNQVAGPADVVEFKRKTQDYVQFAVNGELSRTIKLDKRYNLVLIERDITSKQIVVCYMNYMVVLD